MTGQYSMAALREELTHLLSVGFIEKPALDVSFVRFTQPSPSWTNLKVLLDAKRNVFLRMLSSDTDSYMYYRI